jgi:hypothetical protein
MKQKGNTWFTSDGQTVPKNYVSDYDKAAEKTAQIIFSSLSLLANAISKAKLKAIAQAKKMEGMYRKENGDAKVISFTSFDKFVRIEYDTERQYVRLYQATKENPTLKDYVLMKLDFNNIQEDNKSKLILDIYKEPGELKSEPIVDGYEEKLSVSIVDELTPEETNNSL